MLHLRPMPLPRLVFATRNPGKVKEIAAMLDGHFEIVGLDDIGCSEEVPETTGTIEGNAIQKAEYVKAHYGVDCFADDTGLEVEALGGAPGVDTAFYAGPAKDADANMAKLLGARVAWASADNALQIHGGNGFALEYQISRILCDARILNIFEGAAEIQAQVIARRLLG